MPAVPDPLSEDDLLDLAAAYGSRDGSAAILRLLARHGYKLSYFDGVLSVVPA